MIFQEWFDFESWAKIQKPNAKLDDDAILYILLSELTSKVAPMKSYRWTAKEEIGQGIKIDISYVQNVDAIKYGESSWIKVLENL